MLNLKKQKWDIYISRTHWSTPNRMSIVDALTSITMLIIFINFYYILIKYSIILKKFNIWEKYA